MSDSKIDNNQISTMTGMLNTDGITPTRMQADPTGHTLLASDGTSGSDFGSDNAGQDNNGIRILMAVSEVDGTTPVPLYINSSGQLLIDTT